MRYAVKISPEKIQAEIIFVEKISPNNIKWCRKEIPIKHTGKNIPGKNIQVCRQRYPQ
jgi:hypothetical protein